MKEADVALFLQVTRIRKFRNKCVANLKSNAATARLLTLVKPEEPKHATDRTQTRDEEW